MLRNKTIAFVLALMAATSTVAMGCSSSDASGDEDEGALQEDQESSGWGLDIAKVNAAWPVAQNPVREGHPEDAFGILVDLGEKKIRANTHMFTKTVNIIPYANPNEEAQFATATGGRGDAVIARYIAPGEVGIMIKHHRPEHRYLAMSGGGPEMKEHFKLQDTHIGIVVGVERDGKPGAISINNPKAYEQGAFGNDHYPMIFVKPEFPKGLSAEQIKLYTDNIRTMSVLFNTVSSFPGDYNGGDPLAARNPTQIKSHVAMMVKAIGGDTNAQQWFSLPENKIYCAELAEVAFSAGILVPLSKSSIVGLQSEMKDPATGAKVPVVITEADYQAFVNAVNGSWPFATAPIPSTDGSPNGRLKEVAKYKPDFAAMEALKPISEVVGVPKRADGVPGKGLAFEPMTMADIVQHFLRTHIPRDPSLQAGTELEGMGERIAPMQAGVLAKMEEGLYESMKLPASGPGSEQRARSIADEAELMTLPARVQAGAAAGQRVPFSVKDVFDGIVKTISKSYGNYTEFQKAVQPWLFVARAATGPRGDSGEGLFAPPSLYHVVAQQAHTGGYLGLRYLGHGMHYSVTTPPAEGANSTEREKPPAGPAAPAFAPAGGEGG